MLQFKRKVSLIVINSKSSEENALDLSELKLTFKTQQADVESPNSARIRVFNVSPATINKIRGGFDRVVLQAGYDGQFGVIFDGDLKQIGIGRLSSVDTYLDLFVAEGDLAYNNATLNQTLEAEATGPASELAAVAKSMEQFGVNAAPLEAGLIGGTFQNPRGKVLFGMARDHMRGLARTLGASWSIQRGKLTLTQPEIVPADQAIVLNVASGLVGTPEQTTDGVKVRALINPAFSPGRRVRLDNTTINQLTAANPNAGFFGNLPYNQRVGLPVLQASVALDGDYKIFVVEFTGDSRGQDWYADMNLLLT